MKKTIGILLVISALLLTGCGQTAEPAPTAAPAAPAAPAETAPAEAAPAETASAEPIPTEPDGVPGRVLIPRLGAVLGTLPIGEELSIVSEKDGYCLVDSSVGQGLVEKRLLRLVGEPAFESYTGYAKRDAALYEGYQMLGDGAPLELNTKLAVLEAFDGGFMIQLGEEIGYVPADLLSRQPTSTGGSSGKRDGGDISLTGATGGASVRVQLLANTTLATVLVDKAEVYAAFLNRNDEIKVTEATDESCTIYLDGSFLTVPRRFVALEGDTPFESYTAYARLNAGVYENYSMAGDPGAVLTTNAVITVLGDFGRCCLVEADGALGFMKANAFALQPIAPSSSGGSSSGSWTPPIL